MSRTYCNQLELTARAPLQWNVEIPEFRIQGNCIISKQFPGKTFHIDSYRGQSLLEIHTFLLAFDAPAWTIDEVKHIISAIGARTRHGIFTLDTPILRLTGGSDIVVPSLYGHHGIMAIIMAYYYIPYYEPTVYQMFRQLHFPSFAMICDYDSVKFQNNLWHLEWDSDTVTIKMGDIYYFAYAENDFLISDFRCKSVSYTIRDGKIHLSQYDKSVARRPTYSEIALLPIEVIDHFDPKGEFGLRQTFKPILTTKSTAEVLENPAFQNYYDRYLREFYEF